VEVSSPASTDYGSSTATAKEGEDIALICRSVGARPAAVLTWYNGTNVIEKSSADESVISVSILLKVGKKCILDCPPKAG